MPPPDLRDPATRERLNELIRETAGSAVSPAIAKPKPLPAGLQCWIAFGQEFEEGWFVGPALFWFSALPAVEGLKPSDFSEGATRVVHRLLRPKHAKPFVARPKQHSEQRSIPLERFGFFEFEARICLDCPNGQIVAAFRQMLHEVRKTNARPLRAHRPPSPEVLQRDFVIYVLDRDGWDIISIDHQLRHMGCIPIPPKPKLDPDAFLRKVRLRFRRIEAEIVRPLTRGTERLIDCFLEDFAAANGLSQYDEPTGDKPAHDHITEAE
jgi:hypothetical protein